MITEDTPLFILAVLGAPSVKKKAKNETDLDIS
jgi:hypothetical protein